MGCGFRENHDVIKGVSDDYCGDWVVWGSDYGFLNEKKEKIKRGDRFLTVAALKCGSETRF